MYHINLYYLVRKTLNWVIPEAFFFLPRDPMQTRGGGVLRFGLDGSLRLEPRKPLPMFKGHFGRKWYLFLGIFVMQTPENCEKF